MLRIEACQSWAYFVGALCEIGGYLWSKPQSIGRLLSHLAGHTLSIAGEVVGTYILRSSSFAPFM